MASVRFTGYSVSPSFWVAIQFSSRVCLILLATLPSASLQLSSCQWSEPGARYIGTFTRRGDSWVARMAEPLVQSEPWLMAWPGSPSRLTSLPSWTWPTMPQPHEQKLQAVVYSLAPVSFIARVAALTSLALRPSSTSARAAPVPAPIFSHCCLPRVIGSSSLRGALERRTSCGPPPGKTNRLRRVSSGRALHQRDAGIEPDRRDRACVRRFSSGVSSAPEAGRHESTLRTAALAPRLRPVAAGSRQRAQRPGLRTVHAALEQRRVGAPGVDATYRPPRRGGDGDEQDGAARAADRPREGEVQHLRSGSNAAEGRLWPAGLRSALGRARHAQDLAAGARPSRPHLRRRGRLRQRDQALRPAHAARPARL